MAARATGAMPAIQGAGATADYVAKKARAKVLFDAFADTASSGIVGQNFDSLAEATACSKSVYERRAHILRRAHRICAVHITIRMMVAIFAAAGARGVCASRGGGRQ